VRCPGASSAWSCTTPVACAHCVYTLSTASVHAMFTEQRRYLGQRIAPRPHTGDVRSEPPSGLRRVLCPCGDSGACRKRAADSVHLIDVPLNWHNRTAECRRSSALCALPPITDVPVPSVSSPFHHRARTLYIGPVEFLLVVVHGGYRNGVFLRCTEALPVRFNGVLAGWSCPFRVPFPKTIPSHVNGLSQIRTSPYPHFALKERRLRI
jgi:hypothetical protein